MAIDRTQWKKRNVFMASLIWGTHALPLYFEEVGHKGNSDLVCQKRLLKQVLRLFKSKKVPVLVLGDREFHSPKLADWLNSRDVSFCLRQRKSLYFKTQGSSEYETLKSKEFKPGQSEFYTQLLCNKEDDIGPMNLAVYWKRKYRGKGPKEPWYLLTNLPTLKQALTIYRARWGIEMCQPQYPHRNEAEDVAPVGIQGLAVSSLLSYQWLNRLMGLLLRFLRGHRNAWNLASPALLEDLTRGALPVCAQSVEFSLIRPNNPVFGICG